MDVRYLLLTELLCLFMCWTYVNRFNI